VDVGRLLIVVGLVIAGLGVLVSLGVPLGRLPGDLTVRRGSFSFSFPVVSCLVVSVLLTLVLSWLRR
jgi:hypothetical protein